ncbi:hypothetical protein NBM05_06050 [Rothia sp. AR01]|uniref:Uncharacterized protein n=1 Tax=Rothia santali TaxID=2949643 RepID=A0A9X2KH76_9MICC|nr:hypothetical protein [Rothia santali]MCP3425587.1 hypothetical protein [Rothia santali]
MIGLLGGYQHLGVIMWAFFGMYILGAVLTVTLRSPEDPVHQGAAARQEREAPVGG